MAKLNKVMGAAHVEAEKDCDIWFGYINLMLDPVILRHFDIAGPAADWFYEGPVMKDGKCYMAKGYVFVKKVNFNACPAELRVEFVGIGKLHLLWPFPEIPFDYIN